MTDPLVTTAWLADHLDEVSIVDASWFMPDEQRSGRAEYEAAHIPGAVFFDLDAASDPSSGLPHMLPSPQSMAATLGALGLSKDKTVVVYDALGIFSAPRLWWTLRLMGFSRVFVLDGGLKAWLAEGRSTESGVASPKRTQIAPTFNAALVRDLDFVKTNLAGQAVQMVDARGAPRFRGEVPEPRAGLRSGHIPGAANVPYGSLLQPDGTMRPADEIRAAFDAAGVDLSRPIATTCGSGVTACVLALGLARIGRDDIAVYDGSWSEWGGRDDVPVATGA